MEFEHHSLGVDDNFIIFFFLDFVYTLRRFRIRSGSPCIFITNLVAIYFHPFRHFPTDSYYFIFAVNQQGIFNIEITNWNIFTKFVFFTLIFIKKENTILTSNEIIDHIHLFNNYS